jgi:hypothetical protein
MDLSQAKNTFLSYLPQAPKQLVTILPAEGLDAMLTFYASERVLHCAFDEEGDMLLYQWGTHDWGQGEHFELNITRQFIAGPDGEDDDIKQLSLTFRFVPSVALRQVGLGNRWCHDPGELPEFRDFIKTSAALAAAACAPLSGVSLDFGGV